MKTSLRVDRDPPLAAKPGATKEVVAKLAELLWEKAGRPMGRQADFLLQAEAALRGTNEMLHHEDHT